MKSSLRVLVVLAIALFMSGVYISNISSEEATVPVIKQDSLSGKIEISKERYILVTGKEKIHLALIPPAAMDSLSFHPVADDTLTVKGIISKGILVAHKAWLKGKEYTFRDSAGQPVWKGVATWVNNTKTCIGCRLCVSNCPTEAISMVKNKALIDQTKCTGCNACIAGNLNKFAGCPVKSISK